MSRKLSLSEIVVLLFIVIQIMFIYRYLIPSTKIDILLTKTDVSIMHSDRTANQLHAPKAATRSVLTQTRDLNKDNLLGDIREQIREDEEEILWWKKNISGSIDIMDKFIVREKIKLVLIVTTAPARYDRRESIRQTWWKQCELTSDVKCLFFTDGINEDEVFRSHLIKEYERFQDIYVQPLKGGIEFGRRFLYHLRWATLAYDFEYFMRLDDDEFLCFDRLISDLTRIPKTNFLWSWMHCAKNLVRPEESFLLITQDLVKKFLSQDNRTMLCHPLADQQIGIWVKELGLNNLYHHDPRIHHHPPASSLPELFQQNNMCHKYIAIHGSYPRQMKLFWANRGQNFNYSHFDVRSLATYCPYPQNMEWGQFGPKYLFEPKPCSSNPTWNTSNIMNSRREFYGGREDEISLRRELENTKVELKTWQEMYFKLEKKQRIPAKSYAIPKKHMIALVKRKETYS